MRVNLKVWVPFCAQFNDTFTSKIANNVPTSVQVGIDGCIIFLYLHSLNIRKQNLGL